MSNNTLARRFACLVLAIVAGVAMQPIVSIMMIFCLILGHLDALCVREEATDAQEPSQ